jgi:4-amino-4-deoxy-L-arabinose transferase-like glycosyltransferase
MRSPASRPAAIALLIAVAIVYCWRLGSAPLYLAPDEVIIANDALSLSRTGHTLDGTRFPLYFLAGASRNWFMPSIYYVSAAFLRVLPLEEWAIRLPTALIGILSVALAMLVTRKTVGDRLAVIVSGVVLACSPALFFLSRYALDYTYPLPLILAWLLCVLTALEKPRAAGWFVLAGVCLGIGWYTYISSMVMMPVYAAITLVAMVARKRSWREIAVFAAGFLVPLTFFAVWASHHPDAFQQTAARYNFVDPKTKATASTLLSSFDFVAMFNRFRNFLGIEFLFRLGDGYLPFSTRTTGVFVPATAILLVVGGVVTLVRRTTADLLVLAGFLTAPLAASILVEEGAIRRAAALLIFGALLMAIGAARLNAIERIPFFRPMAWLGGGVALLVGLGYLSYTLAMQGRISETATRVAVIGVVLIAMAALSARMKHGRILVIVNVLVIVMQFATVVRDYHGEYVSRLAPWLQGNIRGALVQLIDESTRRPESPVYFMTLRSGRGDWDVKNRFLPDYWRFYATKLGREDLITKGRFLTEVESVDLIPKGALVLGNVEDPHVRTLLDAGATKLADVPELDRAPFFTVLLR